MMPDRPRVTGVIKTVLALQAILIAAGLTFAADIYAHKRTEDVGGTNIWGYRGAVSRQRQPGEVRIVFVGGSRAFSWGAGASESIPSTVRWLMMLQTDAPGRPLRPVVAINLGALHATASSYAATLEHYSYLAPDYVCIYDDLGLDTSPTVRSRVFGTTGYAPALPTVVAEKGMMLRYGTVAAGYGTGGRTEPGIRAVAGAVLQGTGQGLQTLDRRRARSSVGGYGQSMARAIASARAVGAKVAVAAGPAVTPEQQQNLEVLRDRVSHFAPDQVTLVDLTTVAELADPAMTLDGYNYNGAGRVRVAEAIAPVLLGWMERSATDSRR
jgi:hypothetical protein